MKTKLDLNQLRLEIQGMTRHHALYLVLKDELTALGYWRARGRGDPSKAYRAMVQAQGKQTGLEY